MKLPVKIVLLYAVVITTACAKVTAQDELYVKRYNPVLTSAPKMVPAAKTPDGALAGNGDIGITLGGKADELTFYIGKNDFWRAYPVYPGGGIAHPGGLTFAIKDLKDATYNVEQVMDKASIKGTFSKNDLLVSMNAWVAATGNVFVTEVTANKSCEIDLRLWSRLGNTSNNDSGLQKNIFWVTRSFENTHLLEWPAHVAMAMKVIDGTVSNKQTVQLTAGKKVTIAVTVYTNFDKPDWKEYAVNEAELLSNDKIEQLRTAHELWWKQFWSLSNVRINDPFLEKYYYASQYLFASSTRAGKFAPGLWGVYITRDSTAWGGDYHLNYNYQAPYWASYSSNHISLTENFDQPVLDYMAKGKLHA
ncbi:MAG: trehalose hydrolase, partial [Chitinophagaceae bacterium]|nr:trehalose hydrolase [Chitinophagaceae bacterium]